MNAVIVVPAEERDLWLSRLLHYADEHGHEVVAILFVDDEAVAARDLVGMMAAGEADTILVGHRHHLPFPWHVEVASGSNGDAPSRLRRPQLVDPATTPAAQRRQAVRGSRW